ncbi:hypothetical protein ACM1RC_20920 [Paenibacillus azoreducens]|uniref:hypothetical protein n=1 Tax=Paenibacillus azoreducens TaxID=116718 RepID=UPI0039F53400
MNKYDEKYEIRLAKHSDIEGIMRFINDYWREGHIMSLDRELFEYEYVDGDNVNFVIAIDRENQSIEGIFGFLNCSNTTDKTKKDIWGSMWKVVETHDNIPFLGIELAKRVFELSGCRTQIGNGANPKTTVPLRRMFFGDKVAKMRQYYYLNTEIDEYRIAIINDRNNIEYNINENEKVLVRFESIDDVKKHFDIERIESIPYKDYWYINKRFFNHPYYKYTVFGLRDEDGKIGALMIGREIKCNGGKVFRIVDYMGDQELFLMLGKEFETMVKEHGYEYIDFFTLGFNEEYILRAGFKLRSDNDINVIPNYFEPFVRENADIWAHYKLDGTLFFKADGDQDRPNQLLNTSCIENI